MAFLGFIFLFIAASPLSQSVRASQQGSLYRNQQTKLGHFKAAIYQHLSETVIAYFFTEDEFLCPFKCVAESKCFSYNLAAQPDSNGRHLCEMLATDKYRARHKLQPNATFHHFSPVSSCESNPCQNDGVCIPNFEQNSYHCDCKPGFAGIHCEACKFDFEDGIRGWVKTGTVFDNQPTYGDNPTARNRGQPAKQQGNWWIGGVEHRPTIETPAGQAQGDAPQGTLTMPSFNIIGQYISFLIGGGCNINELRAELIVGNQVVRQTTGKCHETMIRETWDVQEFIGQRGHVRLIDIRSGEWGHLNFDDLKGDISCRQA